MRKRAYLAAWACWTGACVAGLVTGAKVWLIVAAVAAALGTGALLGDVTVWLRELVRWRRGL